jgi:predicted nuclease of predicted toxin-antitoxin system
MKFVADQCVNEGVINRLRQDGHEVISIRETKPGAKDPIILEYGYQQGILLITYDLDFGELVVRRGLFTSGVIQVRLEDVTVRLKAEIVSSQIKKHEQELLGAFTTISKGNVRIRRLF